MGGTSLKKIQDQLEQKYKPIRKFYDEFYGEITVLQARQSHETLAKCQKIFFPSKPISEYIEKRLQSKHELFVQIRQAQHIPMDMCSGNQICVFVMPYFSNTLYQQITKRSEEEKFFQYRELLELFYAMIQAMKLLMQIEGKNRILFSNSSFLYTGEGQIKVLQNIFCNKIELAQHEFSQIYSHDKSQSREYYLSPECYSLFLRKQTHKAKQNAQEQSSQIFNLSMNFLELILLADLSQMYNRENKSFDHQKLGEALANVVEYYNDDLEKLVTSMTQDRASKRPTLADVEEYLRYLMQGVDVRVRDYGGIAAGGI